MEEVKHIPLTRDEIQDLEWIAHLLSEMGYSYEEKVIAKIIDKWQHL